MPNWLLADLDAAELRRRVDRTAKPCGCKSGALALIVALIAWPVLRLSSGAPTGLVGIVGAVLVWMAVVVVAAVLGKLGGIAIGQWRHRLLRRQLHHALVSMERGSGDVVLR